MRKTILFCLAFSRCNRAAFAEPPKTRQRPLRHADGMTLYTFDKDTTPGVSACTGGCMSNWPAAVATRPTNHPATGP